MLFEVKSRVFALPAQLSGLPSFVDLFGEWVPFSTEDPSLLLVVEKEQGEAKLRTPR